METRDLQTFLAVADCASVTRAAEMLGRSQPNVTRTIQELEAELGFDLFHRVGRRIVLSDEGVAFEAEARRMLAAFSELAQRAKAIAAGGGRTLTIAATAAIGAGVLPEALARLGIERLPEVQIATLLPNAVSQEVRSGQAEIGFSSLPLDVPGLDVLRLYSAPDVAAMRADDPLADLDVVPLSAFAGRRLVGMLNPMRFQRHVALAMADRGVRPGLGLRTNVAYAALQIVRHTGAIAVVDPVSAWTVDLPDIVVRPLDVTVPFHWGVIGPVGRAPRPLVLELIEAVEEVARARLRGFTVLDPTAAGRILSHSTLPGAFAEAGQQADRGSSK